MANFTLSKSSGTGDGSFEISASRHTGRNSKSLGTCTVSAGGQTRTITVNQAGCNIFLSTATGSFSNSTSDPTPGASTPYLSLQFYSNASGLKIENLPKDSSASEKIYAWNAETGLGCDENGVAYTVAYIAGFDAAGSSVSPDSYGNYDISDKGGANSQVLCKVTVGIGTNKDDAAIVRKIKISATDQTGLMDGFESLTFTITQSAGSVSLSVSPTTVTIPASGEAQSVTVTCNSTWSVT